MAAHHDKNPFDCEEDDQVNPFSNPSHYSHEPVNYDPNPAIGITPDKAAIIKVLKLVSMQPTLDRKQAKKVEQGRGYRSKLN